LSGNASNVGNYPGEVAAVLSIKGERLPGVSPARARGRVFLGPLKTSWDGGALNGDLILSSIVRQFAVDAAVRMMSVPTDTVKWAVYSPTDGLARRIISASMDDRFDTQRRRGSSPTEKLVGNVSGGI
jgi:hypothetical protein